MIERSELATSGSAAPEPAGEPTPPAWVRSTRPRRAVRWPGVALLPALALAIVLMWPQANARPVGGITAPSVDDPAPEVLALPTLIEQPPSAESSPAVDAVDATEPATTAAATSAPGPAGRPVVPAPATAQVVRVRIPVLAVDAPVQSMGLDASGAMEVPYSPATVAWYGFTAVPGSAGNAVMSGHVDWLGARAVFYGIRTLTAGDVIEVTTSEGNVRYSVERTYLVRPEEADIAAIVGQRRGPETLTLITCGGTFDRSSRDYDHRVIVRATRA